MSPSIGKRIFVDDAGFYPVGGVLLPSVTTVLSALSKPALAGWEIREERKAFERILWYATPFGGEDDRQDFMAVVMGTIAGPPAARKITQAAAALGTAVHDYVEWRSRRMMGAEVGTTAPRVSSEASLCVEAWENWVRDVQYRPVSIETAVACEACGYSGSFDWIGYVEDKLTLGDIKTGARIYFESFLQNVAYRHAARQVSPPLESTQGLVLRLPKVLSYVPTGGTSYEAQIVPANITLDDFLAALRLWKIQRMSDRKETGGRVASSVLTPVHSTATERPSLAELGYGRVPLTGSNPFNSVAQLFERAAGTTADSITAALASGQAFPNATPYQVFGGKL